MGVSNWCRVFHILRVGPEGSTLDENGYVCMWKGRGEEKKSLYQLTKPSLGGSAYK